VVVTEPEGAAQSTVIALARQRPSRASSRTATAREHHDHRFDDAVSRVGDHRSSHRQTRASRLTAGDRPRTRCDGDASKKRQIDLVGHPARELVERSHPRDDLRDAAGQIDQQRSGIDEIAGSAHAEVEVEHGTAGALDRVRRRRDVPKTALRGLQWRNVGGGQLSR
jgi:hypothetical protein